MTPELAPAAGEEEESMGRGGEGDRRLRVMEELFSNRSSRRRRQPRLFREVCLKKSWAWGTRKIMRTKHSSRREKLFPCACACAACLCGEVWGVELKRKEQGRWRQRRTRYITEPAAEELTRTKSGLWG